MIARDELATEIGIGVGLGTFPFASVFGSVTQAEAIDVFHAFIKSGGRYVETAPSYPYSSVDIGEMLATIPRSSYFLATKCVTGVDEIGRPVRSGRSSFLRWQVERELSRLRTESVDLLQAHNPPDDTSMDDLATILALLREEGLCRFIGISNVTFEQVRAFSTSVMPDFIQNRWSLLHRSSHDPLIGFCKEHRVYFNPYQAIERGQLTDEPSAPENWSVDDLRRRKPEYQGEPDEVIRDWIARDLRPLAREAGHSVESLAIGWVLSQPQVAVVVVGAKTPSQIRALADPGKPLDSHLVDEIDHCVRTLEERIRGEYGQSLDAFRGLP
jgi:myo-inositol catabolism protein IolS